MTKTKRKPKAAIFSGERSSGMWKHINKAETLPELRMALYAVACRCQELESEVRRPNTELTDRRGAGSLEQIVGASGPKNK